MMLKAFLRQEKWNLLFFFVVNIIGFVSSVILIGGPVSYSGPIGLLTGMILLEISSYRRFKKEWKSKNQFGYTFNRRIV